LNRLLRALLVIALSLAATAPARAAAPAASSDYGLAELAMGALAQAKARIEALGGDLAQTPGELRKLDDQARKALMSGTGVRGFTYLLILLLVGSGVEWLYWTYAYAPYRLVQSMPVSSPRQALRAALRRLAYLGSGLLLFAVAAIGASAAFTWPQGVQELAVAATLFLVFLRLAWIAAVLVLAPGRAQLRLAPVEPRKARWLAAAAMTVVLLVALGRFVPDLLERIGDAPHAANALRLAIATLAALLLVAAAFAFIGRPRQAAAAGPGRAPPRLSRSFIAILTIVAVYALWILGSATAGSIAAIAAIVIALQMALRDWVFFFWDDDEHRNSLLPGIVLSAVRFLVVVAGIGACAIALDTPVAELAASEKPLVLFGLRVLGVAALVLLANMVWTAIRTSIDHRLRQINAGGSHDGPSPGARLLTLLPLLRVTMAVLLGVVLIMASLWALGIEITPLLAGAGVVGLALGFGAQALVRDVIAGIFFLAEDAFRIGEYIESGTTTKGTVERITLRTVALRHHNGPLHFVPYGALGTVRNTSRDWVIEKFNIPLPIGVDSERIRKMIKKIGEEMLADPEVGPLIIETLKGKLYRIDPGVKIFRCKFRTAPGKQFDVRAQALKRVEAALKAIGVGFADGTQTVLLPAVPAA
jgi:moderate conductance mechanosensitive channel